MRLIDADGINIHDVSPEYGFVVMGVTEEDIGLEPTIDAVPVVRCRDCTHWNSVMKESEFGLCDAWVTLFICTGSDEYCKRGKKKEA